MTNRFKRRLWWCLSNGPGRLRSARLRRQGNYAGAFVALMGVGALIRVIRECPDDVERQELLRSLSRKLATRVVW